MPPASTGSNPVIDRADVALYRVPGDRESDGTLAWDHTDVVLVRLEAGGAVGTGWSYASRGAAALVDDILLPVVRGRDAMSVEGAWRAMTHQLRNAGLPGAGMMAVSAVDVALWDLKARLLGVALVDLLGAVRGAVDVYGSGGFTSYTDAQLAEQLSGWAGQGIGRVKMKVGRDPAADPHRVRVARAAIGESVALFVDANGAYERTVAVRLARQFSSESGVVWFEEPRPSSDLAGLRFLRDHAPPGMDVAAGEYGDTLDYFRRMVAAGAVDCLQADATRCGGYTGFRAVAALCDAVHVPLSAHCAPQLHAHVACAVAALRHVEYFHDHVRVDRLLFDGVLEPERGTLCPDHARRGHGLTLRERDAERYRV